MFLPIASLAQVAPPVPATSIEVSAAAQLFQYGVIGVLVVVFALVIRSLYKENRVDRKEAADSDKKHVAELVACEERCRTEKETLKVEHEKRHRELLESYAKEMIRIRDLSEKREDDIRRETATMIAALADSNSEASEALMEMLQQFLNKVVK